MSLCSADGKDLFFLRLVVLIRPVTLIRWFLITPEVCLVVCNTFVKGKTIQKYLAEDLIDHQSYPNLSDEPYISQ